MKKLAIIGSGDLALQIIHLAKSTKKYEVVGCFDDFALIGKKVGDISVVGKLNLVFDWYKEGKIDELIIGVGYTRIEYRKLVFEVFFNLIPFGNIIHDSAIIDSSANLGQGLVIMAGCVIDFCTTIENNVLLNIGTKIAHHSTIKKHSFLAPNVSIAGFSKIGECCNLGISTTIINNLNICDNVRTGASTTIIKDIESKGLYVGTPPRLVKEKW